MDGEALSLHCPLLDQFIEGMEIRRLVALEIALHLCWVVLEGCDLSLALLIEQFQLLMLLQDSLTIESHLLALAIKLHLLFLHLLSSYKAFRGVGFRTAEMIRQWRSSPEARRSQCPRYDADYWLMEGPGSQQL